MEAILNTIPFGPIQLAEVNHSEALLKTTQKNYTSIIYILLTIAIGGCIIIAYDVIQKNNFEDQKT